MLKWRHYCFRGGFVSKFEPAVTLSSALRQKPCLGMGADEHRDDRGPGAAARGVVANEGLGALATAGLGDDIEGCRVLWTLGPATELRLNQQEIQCNLQALDCTNAEPNDHAR